MGSVNMKSTPKQSRFVVNERVLCYEPDLTKARVVYDAKILKVEDASTRKNPKEFHYQVHFQGWSSTWDRYVTEEFLLKTNDKNRDLQRKLFQEAHAASSQKKKRKQKSDALSISISEEGSTNSPPAKKQALESPRSVTTEEDSADDQDAGSSSQDSIPASSASVSPASVVSSKSAKRNRGRTISQDGSECENQAPIRLTDELKSILEEDFRQVTKKRKLKELPSKINVAAVLEDFVRHYAATQLVTYEKQLSKTYYTANRKEVSRELFANVQDSINLAKEIADTLRIIFDFNLKQILLYGSHGETKQYHEVMKPGKVQKRISIERIEVEQQYCYHPNDGNASSRSSTTSGRSSATPSLNPPSASPTSPQSIKVLRELHEWRLIPDSMYEEKSQKPLESMIYGPIFLLRLLVKLPDVMGKMELLPPKTRKTVGKYVDAVVDYLQSHQDLLSSSQT